MMKKALLGILVASCAAGCQAPAPNLPVGPSAYQTFPTPAAAPAGRPYLVGPLDKLAINVFQEPDLSLDNVQVDAAGNILLPLVGMVHASGKTTNDLAQEIASVLGGKYLVNPQVSVLVQESVSQTVTVEGEVADPGVFPIKGRATLLDAIALAKGTTRTAKADEVVVFRQINGQRMGALFDVRAIQRGEADDPEILGNDTVVVGFSSLQAAWRDLLMAAPLIAIFRPFN